MVLRLEDFDLGLMAPQQLAQPAVRIAHIADDPRPAHARLHARRQQSRFQPVHAEGAFVRRLGGVIDKTGIVRTGLHAIGAPHAAFVVDHHDPVLALEGGTDRAYRHAGRVVAVVAQPGSSTLVATSSPSRLTGTGLPWCETPRAASGFQWRSSRYRHGTRYSAAGRSASHSVGEHPLAPRRRPR